MERISIVLCSDDAFAQHGAVAMLSVVQSARDPSKIDFYYIDGGLSEKSKEKIRKSLADFAGNLCFLEANLSQFQDAYISHYYSVATYYRLLLPQILPKEVTRCLYMDCDMVVDGDVEELWNTDLLGAPVGAVLDLGVVLSSRRISRKEKVLGNLEGKYFNAGLLLIDLDAWRCSQYAKQAIDLAISHKYESHDQDALNAVFARNWHQLSFRWNKMPAVWGFHMKLLMHCFAYKEAIQARFQKGITHYASRHKPWECREISFFNKEYYDVLRKTPFSEGFQPRPSRINENHSNIGELIRILLGAFFYRVAVVFTGKDR